LAGKGLKPAVLFQLPHEADQNQLPRSPEPSPIPVRPNCVHRSTVRTPVALDPKWFVKVVEKPPYIPMTPDTDALAFRATKELRPRVLFAFLF